MNLFNPKTQRRARMTATVSYRGQVPMPRALAYVLHHIDTHGGSHDVFSADRRDSVIAAHNRAFHTQLHGQQWLVDAHARDPQRFNPANSPATTSHCYRSDGSAAYHRPAGAKLPWYMLGIDLSDRGRVEDPTHFLAVAHHLGYPFVQPYPVGGERHHVILTRSPISQLVRSHQIAKLRGVKS